MAKPKSKPQTATSLGLISGELVDIFTMETHEVKAWDIVWALHQQNRYLGHTPVAWDVLSHTALCYSLAIRDANTTQKPVTTADALGLLLHDASEAYMGDMPRPLKTYFTEFVEIEHKVTAVILNRFGLRMTDVDWDFVKKYDNEALWTEQATFGRTNDKFYGSDQLDKKTMLRMVKCHPMQFITQLRELCLQRNVDGVNALFEMPQIIMPYLSSSAQQAQIEAAPKPIKRSALDDAVDVTEMRV